MPTSNNQNTSGLRRRRYYGEPAPMMADGDAPSAQPAVQYMQPPDAPPPAVPYQKQPAPMAEMGTSKPMWTSKPNTTGQDQSGGGREMGTYKKIKKTIDIGPQ